MPINKFNTSIMADRYDEAVDDMVKSDYRTADVFKKYGINYCCAGRVSLGAICSEKNIDPENVKKDLEQATRTVTIPSSLQFAEWRLDFLIDYIIHIHHQYIDKAVPALGSALLSFGTGHSKKYPEILRITGLFDELSAVLVLHIRQEDEIIFPYIKQIDSANRRKDAYGNLFVRTLRKSLGLVEKENGQIGNLLNQIRELISDFSVPDKVCTNYQVLFHKLEEFCNNLRHYQFLESHILFPGAIAIEQQLLQ